MNSADNPLIRGGNPFEKRTARAIAQAKPNVASPHVFSRPLPGGTSLSTKRARSAPVRVAPLFVGATGIVEPGTVLGVMPKIDATFLDASNPPTLSIPSSGVRYVVITITGDFVVSSHNSQSYAAAALSNVEVTIDVTTERPDAEDLQSSTPATYKVLLATFSDGVKTAQNGYGPITGSIQDKLDGSGTGLLILSYAVPS